MKKTVVILFVASAVLFASCGAALTGAALGGSLGSAIGGISNGPRGHDMGLLIGTVGGAVVGAAVESAVDRKEANQRAEDQRKYEEEKARLAANRQARQMQAGAQEEEVCDEGGEYADDRIDIDFGESDSYIEDLDNASDDGSGARYAAIEIQNVRFVDSDGSNTIQRLEQCEISFEIYNAGNRAAVNIEPAVTEKSSGGHIQVSPSILIESLAAGKGIRYTARVKADNAIKDGNADFEITVTLDGEPTDTDIVFSIPTTKETSN
ncbi:MAG: glycine zipper domain-containing protein [Prevotella sp.]|nr:glycine zipper domain-containing protein [Prevotella sp.]